MVFLLGILRTTVQCLKHCVIFNVTLWCKMEEKL